MRPKIVTIIGARQQFIKAAAVSPCLKGIAKEILIHTGQHYDEIMADVFFKGLKIRKPDYNLGIGRTSESNTKHIKVKKSFFEG